MSALPHTGRMRYTLTASPKDLSSAARSLQGDRPTTTSGVNVSHISSVLNLQGRSRRNAQRQLAVIRLERSRKAEAARAVAHEQASASPPVTGEPHTPW